jgi:hypothetical protein
MKSLGYVLLTLALAAPAFGVDRGVPEIDGNTAASAVALIAGGLLILRSRKK